MPVYFNKEKNKRVDYQGPEYMEDGTNIPISKGYRKVLTVIKDGQEKEITDDILDQAVAKGYKIKELADAEVANTKYKAAKIGEYGDVSPTEAAVRGALQNVPIIDETFAAVKSPIGAAKAAAQYLGAEVDENDPKYKAYVEERDLHRSRDEIGREENPAAYYGAQLTTGLGVGTLASKATSLAGKVGLAAVEGGAVAAGAGEGETIADDAETIALGAAVPAAATGVIGAATKGASAARNRFANKGDGLGAKYLDNPELLKDAQGASERAKDITQGAKVRNAEAAPNLQRIDQQMDQAKDVIKSQQAEILARKAKVEGDINSAVEASSLYKEAAKESLEQLKVEKTEEGRKKLSKLLTDYENQLSELGNLRTKRFETLEGFEATEQAKQAYRNFKNKLQDSIGELEGDQAVAGLRELEKYMPEDGLDYISQGQLLKRMKRVNDELWRKVKPGQGGGTQNFNKRIIAQEANDAFKAVGDEEVTKLTEAMFEPLNKRNVIRSGAATKSVGMTPGGKETKVFAPDPMKAERARPETTDALKRSGYEPGVNKATGEAQSRITKDAQVLDQRIADLKQEKAALGGLAPKAQAELDSLVQQKRAIQDSLSISNNEDQLRILGENAKTIELNKIDGKESLAEAAIDVGADFVPGVVGRASRGIVGRVASPVAQIQAHNAVREFFQNPKVTATVRALTLGGRALTRSTIMTIAEQNGLNPVELEEVLRQSGAVKD